MLDSSQPKTVNEMTAQWCVSQSERYGMWAWICLVVAAGSAVAAWRTGTFIGFAAAAVAGAFCLQNAWNARFYQHVVTDPSMWAYVTRPELDADEWNE